MKNNRGFTLVEVIVVLVILAILAAIMIPSMTGWIDKAQEQKYVADARLIYTAAQSAISEQYGTNPDFQKGIQFYGSGSSGEKYGRVTDYMLYRVQNNRVGSNDSAIDAAIAKQVLAYLDSSAKSSARYKFNGEARPDGSTTVNQYYSANKQPGIVIVYDKTGTVVYVDFGIEHTLVHIDSEGLTVDKDVTFSGLANGR